MPDSPSPDKVEAPHRLKRFSQNIENIEWKPDSALNSLSKVFSAIDDLAVAEVEYYFGARKKHMFWSQGFRASGWLFASIGTLIPLLAATGHGWFIGWAPWGYVWLAAAASLIGGNAVFDSSTGHIRFVTTQLQLERLITRTRLDWQKFCREHQSIPLETPAAEKGFEILAQYSSELYELMLLETGAWAKVLMTEMEKLHKDMQISAQRKGATNAK